MYDFVNQLGCMILLISWMYDFVNVGMYDFVSQLGCMILLISWDV